MTEEANEMDGLTETPQTMVETTDLPPDGAIQEAYVKLCEENNANSADPEHVETEIDNSPVGTPPAQPVKISCHKCGQKLDLSTLEPFSHVACPACGSDLIVPRWFDNYLLEEIAGIGGMATVYRALDLALDREVAIKVLQPELALQMDKSELFLHEARTAATINHYAVIPIYTCGIFENQTYIVMQYMGGGSLETILAKTQEPLPLLHVISWIRDIAMGLNNAFQHGIIHHDIKPANIMLDMEAKAKVGDFGIAQIITGSKNGIADEVSRGWVSPHYASPEKIRTGEEDFRGDIYSLGATFYHLVTGLTPYPNAELEELIQKRLSAEPMAPHLQRTDLPEALSTLILSMMAMDPEQRPSYENIVAVLNRYINKPELLSAAGSSPSPKKAVPRATKPSARKRDTNSAFNRLNGTVVRKKRTAASIVFTTLMYVISILLLIFGSMYALFEAGAFNESEFLYCYPDFLLESLKEENAEPNKNQVLTNYLHDGGPDYMIKESDLQIKSEEPDIRYQAALQVCFAEFLNSASLQEAQKKIEIILNGLEKNITPYESIRFEDHLALMRYMTGKLQQSELVPGNKIKFELSKDFKLKLAFVNFFEALHKEKEKEEKDNKLLLQYLEDIEKQVPQFKTSDSWVVSAFEDRLPLWKEVLDQSTGTKDKIEPVFRAFIKHEAPFKTEITYRTTEFRNKAQEKQDEAAAEKRKQMREKEKEAKAEAKKELTKKNLEYSMRRHRDVYRLRPNMESRTDNDFLVNKEAQERYMTLLSNSGNLSADDQISEQWRIKQMANFNAYLLELGQMKKLSGLSFRGKNNVTADVVFSKDGVEFKLVDGPVRYGEDEGEKEFMPWNEFREKHICPLLRACISKQLKDLEASGKEPSDELRKKLAHQYILVAVIHYWYKDENSMEFALKNALDLSKNDPEIKALIYQHFLR